jgi:hypothetical protein
MSGSRLSAVPLIAVLAVLSGFPLAGASAATGSPGDRSADQTKSPTPTVFYANDSSGDLTSVTYADGKATHKILTKVASPVWWRTFYLTPTAAAGAWVVGSFSGGQSDILDAPRLFAFDPATAKLHWLTLPSSRVHSPVVDARKKKPRVYYVSGATVRRSTPTGTHDHRIYTAPSGWSISALTVAGTAFPYVALTRTTGLLFPTSSTYVVHLTTTPKTVIPTVAGSVTALALSPNGLTLAVSRVIPDGDSVLTLNAEAPGGLQKTLPNLGKTSEVSWSTDGRTLAVDPQEWGGWMLVDVASGITSFPTAMQRYGGGVFAPAATADSGHDD